MTTIHRIIRKFFCRMRGRGIYKVDEMNHRSHQEKKWPAFFQVIEWK